MNTAKRIAKVIRKSLLKSSLAPETPIGIALSGGVDSNSILAALLENDHEPTVFSYTPTTHESTDFKMARDAAKMLQLNFVPVYVSMEADDLEEGVRSLVAKGFKTKLEVECLSPVLGIMEAAKEASISVMFTGDQADGYFINNNWMARNFDRARGIPGPRRQHVKLDEDPWRIDELRRIYFEEDRSCSGQVTALGKERGLGVCIPYRDSLIRKAFQGTHWNEVNSPRTKEPIKLAFEDWFRRIPVRPEPVNLHRGDSYFAVSMGRILMAQDHLKGPWKTVTGLYSAMARGDA